MFLQCNQPCHKPRCKVCSHIDTRCSIKFDNNVTFSATKADCDSQNVVYILFCAKYPNALYVGETSNRFRFQIKSNKIKLYFPTYINTNMLYMMKYTFRLSNHKHSIKHNFSGYPVAMHFNEQSHTVEDLRCIIIKNYVTNMDNRKLIEQKTIIKLNTHITGLNKDRDFSSHYDL